MGISSVQYNLSSASSQEEERADGELNGGGRSIEARTSDGEVRVRGN